jgi:SAM-dependent methyltransferase
VNWLEINRANWDARVPIHLNSELYDIPSFLAGRETILPYEPDEVGDVRGKRLLHLQCHIGLDTLCWARRGATVTGLDFSRPAIAVATDVAKQMGDGSARFVVADVYDAAAALDGETFDIVYDSIGSLQYLPDLHGWAENVAALVARGGFCYVTEGHPLVRMLAQDCRSLEGDYFSGEPILVDQPDYANPSAPLEPSLRIQWLHQTAEVITALGTAGLRVEFIHEHDWVGYPLLPVLVQGPDGHWRFPDGHPTIPLLYSLKAVKD